MYYDLWLKLESLLVPGLNEKERHDLAGLDEMSPEEQARLDIRLHMAALQPGEDRFDSNDQRLLADDISRTKLRFINLLKDQNADPQEVKDVIRLLKRDIRSHLDNLGMPSEEYGSKAWHQTWIRVYENWINLLSRLLASGGSSS